MADLTLKAAVPECLLQDPLCACKAGKGSEVFRRGSRRRPQGLLSCLTNRQLWGDQWNQPPLTPRRATLSDLVSQDVLRKGAVFMGFLPGSQWLLSYVGEPDRGHELPPLCFYRLQWWFFTPGQCLHLVRETLLFGGYSLEAPLVLNVTQWPCDPTCILVSGCSRLEEELWYVTVVRIPGSGEVLNARYQCSLGSSGQPQLLNKDYLLLPMGQELVLLEMQENRDWPKSTCGPSDGWSSIGVQRHAELDLALLSLNVVPPPQYAIVLDVELLANTLAEELCAQHGLAYVGLLDYNAYVAAGASQGTEATLFLAFLVEASCLPVLDGPPGGRCGTCYAAALLLQWDLRTGFHRVVTTGSLKEGLDRQSWPPSWGPELMEASIWLTNHAVLRGKPLTSLRSGPWEITLT